MARRKLRSGWLNPVSALLFLITCSVANHDNWWSCNRECARCVRRVTPMEELIVMFYPGLFSQTPPENYVTSPDMTNTGSSTLNSGTASIPGSRTSGTTVSSGANPVDPSISSDRQTFRPSTSGCCETVMEYVTPPNVTIRGQVYRVVHLSTAFQFIPIGKCRQGSTCSQGECVEQYRAHWVLVYNATKPVVGPPVSFSPIEVPSHCECMNVGRP